MKNFLSTNICLISVTIQKNLFDQANKKVIGKMKDESEGKIIGEFVGLKWKMYSMKNIESNMAKGVKIATEFNEFKDTLFNNKIRKKHKMGT